MESICRGVKYPTLNLRGHKNNIDLLHILKQKILNAYKKTRAIINRPGFLLDFKCHFNNARFFRGIETNQNEGANDKPEYSE